MVDITQSLGPEEEEYKCGAHRAVRRWAVRVIRVVDSLQSVPHRLMY